MFLDAAGAPVVVQTILEAAKHGATLGIVAVYKKPIDVDFGGILGSELTIVLSVGYPTEIFEVAHGRPVALVTAGLGLPNPGRTEVGRDRTPSALPPEWIEPLPELGRDDFDIVIVKRAWSAFAGTGLHEMFAEQGVTQVVVVGLATSFGVESTARGASDLGYSVVVATDATTDLQAASYEGSITRVLPVLGETGTTDEVLALL